jgi:hypothetical protein
MSSGNELRCSASGGDKQRSPGIKLCGDPEHITIQRSTQSVSGELLRGPIYRQIASRKGEASPFLNGSGDSETIGAAKRTATKSANTA